jgi:hypothetical protein
LPVADKAAASRSSADNAFVKAKAPGRSFGNPGAGPNSGKPAHHKHKRKFKPT